MIRYLTTALLVGLICAACSSEPKVADRDTRKEVARLRKVVDAGGGDAAAGKTIFTARCGACHTLNGHGGTVGPDLTPYLRDADHIDFILESVVRPEAMVHEYHPTVVVHTIEGGFYVGTVLEMDTTQVLLALPGGDQIAIPRAKVESVEDRPQSLMPSQTLAGLSDNDVRDLFAYIMAE